eukprot:TRINITY_DN10063_c0_g1_i1.p1 TRINITY_DN10063_c0_g1~~TRINITY_DN10063_c0_g1_i1.p1  ORF type:complete len:1206 (+),score=461.47 TRINITY_DN10063_c0_g1_i1:142-3759(+)
MSLENGSSAPVEDAVSAEPAAAPTYADAFPSLPMGTTAARPAGRSFAAASGSAVRSSRVTEICRIPFEEQKYKNASGMSGNEFKKVLGQIRKDTGANIAASHTKDNTLSLSISGRKSEVVEAKKACLAKLQTQASIDVSIPKEHHRFIIGSKGSARQEIENKYACRISIPKADDPSLIIKIVGTAANCRAAAKEVQDISNEKGKNDTIRLEITKAYHPLLAGYDQKNFREMTAGADVKIHMPPASSDNKEIVITGEKVAVAQVNARLQALYGQLQATCGELTAQVPIEKHRFVIGPKGVYLREIMEKTGVVVEVPPADKASETIILRGHQQNLVHALTMVYERANSISLEKVTVPGWLHKHIIGPKGANAKALTAEMPKVHINFLSESNTIEIEGPPAEVAVVRAKISAMATDLQQRLTFDTVDVDPKFHGHIVGSQGSNIKAIQAETQCKVDMPKEGNTIRIEGPAPGVASAKAQLTALATKLANQRAIDIIIPQKYHASIIGQGGAKIKELSSQYPDLSINFPSRSNESEIISVRGDKKAVEAADAWFKKAHKTAEAEGYEQEVVIYRRYHSDIIGKQGANIRKIRDECQVRIDVPAADANSDVILLTGRKENCAKAKEMMEKIQAEVADIVQDKVSIPKQLHGFVIGPKGKFIHGIQEEFEVKIDIKNGSDEVSVSGPSENVPRAIAKLKTLAEGGENMSVEEMKVDPKHHRYLVGRGRATQHKIEADAGLSRMVLPGRKLRAGEEADVVTLIGSKEACAKAKATIEAMVKDFESTVEKKVELDSQYFKLMRARRAQFLQGLEDEFNCKISVPRADEAGNFASNTVVVKGAPAAVDLVIEKLQAFVHRAANSTTEAFTVEVANLPALMGQKGVHIQRIQQDCNVTIEVPDRASRTPDQATIDMSITGLPEDVAAAKAEFEALTPIAVEYDLPFEYHRHLIGQKGADIREFQNKYDVRLDIPKPEEQKNSITIRGVASKIAAAKEGLKEKMPQLEDAKAQSFSMTIVVPNKHHSSLIGQRGAVVNKLRETYGVRLDFNKESDDIVLTGYQEKCEECAADIAKRVEELDSYITKPVQIHPSIHGRIVGSRGANIRAIQDKHNVRINMPRDKQSADLEVTGPEAGVDACIEELLEIQEEMEDEIASYEDMQRYIKPTREEPKKKSKPQQFAVRDAPWSAGGDASFPTLGNNASAGTSSMGVWGRR